EDGIRDFHVTGVQTCALPISGDPGPHAHHAAATTRIVTTALDGDDVLYAVEAVDDRVELFTSRDGGRTYSEPVIVAAGEAIDARSQQRRVGEGSAGRALRQER